MIATMHISQLHNRILLALQVRHPTYSLVIKHKVVHITAPAPSIVGVILPVQYPVAVTSSYGKG